MVIVGETNRGKSSLLNALIGAPGASPVDAGVATCTWLLFQHSPTPTAVGHFGNGMADITFPVERLAAFATVDGEPDNDLPPPRWIEVGLPIPLLESVNLVDTPGVGGLVAAHAELAAEAAAGATALLFVIDASAPFTRGELDFLDLVGDRVDAVHFAVTKTDAYRGWREIVQADRELLARHVPRFTDAPFHPVSSRLAEAAATQPDPSIARMVLDQSGLPELRRVLAEDVVARAHLLAEANAIRTAVTVLEGSAEQLATTRRALTAGAAQAERLKLRREELLGQRKTGGRSWQVMLRAEIQRARVELTHETAREVREAQQMFRGAIEGADNDQLKKLPFHIDAYAQAMTVRAHGRLVEAMNRIVHTVLTELFTAEELRVLAANLATRPYERLVTRAPERQSNVDDKIMSMAGAGMGFTLGSLVPDECQCGGAGRVRGGAAPGVDRDGRRGRLVHGPFATPGVRQAAPQAVADGGAERGQGADRPEHRRPVHRGRRAADAGPGRRTDPPGRRAGRGDQGGRRRPQAGRHRPGRPAQGRRRSSGGRAWRWHRPGEALLQRIRHTRPMNGGVLLPGGVTATTPAGRSILVPAGSARQCPVPTRPRRPVAGVPGSGCVTRPPLHRPARPAFPDLRALLNARNQSPSPPMESPTGPPTDRPASPTRHRSLVPRPRDGELLPAATAARQRSAPAGCSRPRNPVPAEDPPPPGSRRPAGFAAAPPCRLPRSRRPRSRGEGRSDGDI